MRWRLGRATLLIDDAGESFVIYDRKNSAAFRLNHVASIVWEQCTSGKSVAQIAKAVSSETGLPADERVVLLAFACFKKAGLLETGASVSGVQDSRARKQLIQELGLNHNMAGRLPSVKTLN